MWFVTEEGGTRRFPVSHYSDQFVDIGPSRNWQVELRRGSDVICDARFEGFDHVPALFFDMSGEQIPPGMGIEAGNILVLRQRRRILKGVVGDDMTTLDSAFYFDGTSAWSGFVCEEVRVKDVNALAFVDDTDKITRTLSVRTVVKPTLEGSRIDGVREGTGAPVVSGQVHLHLPDSDIPWSISVEVDGLRHTVTEPNAQQPGFGGSGFLRVNK